MLSFHYLIVYGLLFLDFSIAMRRIARGMRVGNADAEPQGEVLPANPQADEAALQQVMQQDPCWTAPHFPANNHPASVTCRRAANAFNSRNEEDRHLCPYTVDPKCRFFAGTYAQQCSVKKLRPRSQAWCTILGSRHVPVALSHCAQPLFPGVPAAVPPAELAMYRRM